MSATVYLELSRHLISCNSGGNKKCSLQHRTQREQVPTIGYGGSGGLRILAEPAKRKAAGGESLRTSSNAPMRCERTQSLLSTTPQAFAFFSDLPEHPLRKEWTALENGVHGREKIMGIHFVHVPVMGPRFVVVRQQKSHCLELTTPFHPHLNVEGAHLD